MTSIKDKPAVAAIKDLLSQSPDGLREIVRAVMQEMLEAEMTDALQATKGERTAARLGYRSFESQAFRASGLNLVVSAIAHWNTVYLGHAVDHLRRQGRIIRPEVLKHVSPLSWEHINLTGTYAWGEEPSLVDGFRPLRLPQPLAQAA